VKLMKSFRVLRLFRRITALKKLLQSLGAALPEARVVHTDQGVAHYAPPPLLVPHFLLPWFLRPGGQQVHIIFGWWGRRREPRAQHGAGRHIA
jgi:hypothetical protein